MNCIVQRKTFVFFSRKTRNTKTIDLKPLKIVCMLLISHTKNKRYLNRSFKQILRKLCIVNKWFFSKFFKKKKHIAFTKQAILLNKQFCWTNDLTDQTIELNYPSDRKRTTKWKKEQQFWKRTKWFVKKLWKNEWKKTNGKKRTHPSLTNINSLNSLKKETLK